MTTTLNDIRATFLDFFRRNGHEVVSSSPLVPQNDPTLMFTNAGMVQFKNVFTGAQTRPYSRATTSQKVVRAGGKHNDLENVGYTARHLTFFEMLGNFSFGDYFKGMAIPYAWELLTKDYGLPKEKLYVTVYHTDDEAANIWKKVAGFGDERIIRIPTSDNFWAMGDTGPCGPCSEIFYDHGPQIAGGLPGTPEEDGDRYVEIWNLVFMQYEQLTRDERINLPKPSIDTGMGLERMSTVLQKVHSVFEVDLFKNLIAAIAERSRSRSEGGAAASHRVIADHLRSSCFLIADGVMPSNEGRGYVLRRIMRRSMRHAHQLGCKEPLMHRLVPDLIREMGGQYPELGRAQALMTETLKLEEERFKDMLGRGLKLLDEEVAKLGAEVPFPPAGGNLTIQPASPTKFPSLTPSVVPEARQQYRPSGVSGVRTLPGEVAFKLYDTYGFPLDLTADILRGQGLDVDTGGFDTAMAAQKAAARAAWSGSGAKATDRLWFDLRGKLPATEFLGYTAEHAEATVLALVKDGAEVPEVTTGDHFILITNQTPFYGESGGQMGDTGTGKTSAAALAISDAQKPLPDLFIHHATVQSGSLKVGETIDLIVDAERRASLRAHHSATHLLHASLRKRLGEHVTQKGSLVAPDKLRFDFSHPKALTREDILALEDDVNRQIRYNTEATTRLMTPEEAIKRGAMALFGEKYGDEVRVLAMGRDDYSIELCGGTHVNRTGDIGMFKITGDSAVSAGVRRVEAVVGASAAHYVRKEEAVLDALAEIAKTGIAELPARIGALLEERRRLEKEIADLRKAVAMSGGKGADSDEIENVNGVQFLGKTLDGIPARDLKPIVDDLKKKIGSGVVAVVSGFEGKAAVVVGVTADLVERYSAVQLVKPAVEALGGNGGGGRPDMAQGGGADVAKLGDAVRAVRSLLAG